MAKFLIEDHHFAALVTVIAADIGLWNVTIRKVLAFHFLQVLLMKKFV